jgi:hypothetical protein
MKHITLGLLIAALATTTAAGQDQQQERTLSLRAYNTPTWDIDEQVARFNRTLDAMTPEEKEDCVFRLSRQERTAEMARQLPYCLKAHGWSVTK